MRLRRSLVAPGRLVGAALLALVVLGCPSRPQVLVYDLAARARFAEPWSRREVLIFGSPGSEPNLVEGFFREAPGGGDGGFAWARREAELALLWPAPAERAGVVELSPFPGVKNQRVEVRLNGARVAEFALNDARHAYALPLPQAQQRAGENRLRFVFASTAAPNEADAQNPDDRQLAASFHALTVALAGDSGLEDLLRKDAPSPFAIAVEAQVPHLSLVGDAGLRFALRLPPQGELRFIPELDPGAQAANLGAVFSVTLEDVSGREREVWARRVGAHDSRVDEVVVRLPGRPGDVVRLGLHVTGDPGARFVWGSFRAPRVLGGDAMAGVKPTPFSATDARRADGLRQTLAGTNVVLVILDAARAQQFSSYGYGRATTPQLDRLASEGIVFECAFTPAVYTLAAMSSVWTSQYPDRHHGELAFSAPLPSSSFTLAGLLSARAVTNAGFVANAMAGKAFGLALGFQKFDEQFRDLGSGAAGFRRRVPAFLEANRGNRFFAYLHFREPHFPYDPPTPFDTQFGPTGALTAEQSRDSNYFADVNRARRPFTEQERARLVQLYDGNLAYADAEFGNLRAELERQGLWERTIVIVTGDHGEALHEHGYIGHNTQLYEESVRVPLIVRLPTAAGIKGRRVSGLVDLLDIAPTVADVFGLAETPDALKHFQGRSLLPVIAGAPGKSAVLSRTLWDRPRYALRDSTHKFIYDTRSGDQELYDLTADPTERANLAAGQPLLAAYYRESLHEWIASLGKERGAAATKGSAPPDCETCQNLKALGYIGADVVCRNPEGQPCR